MFMFVIPQKNHVIFTTYIYCLFFLFYDHFKKQSKNYLIYNAIL